MFYSFHFAPFLFKVKPTDFVAALSNNFRIQTDSIRPTRFDCNDPSIPQHVPQRTHFGFVQPVGIYPNLIGDRHGNDRICE